jgi:hypothetical protein
MLFWGMRSLVCAMEWMRFCEVCDGGKRAVGCKRN